MRLALVGSAWILAGMTFFLDTRAADRLFPSRPLSLMTSVGITSWMFVLFGMTTGQVTVFMPLVVQTLCGISPLGTGYFTSMLSFSWTALALCSAGWQNRRARLAILLGPLVIICGVIGLGARVGFGSLCCLGFLLLLVGAGIGVYCAHISSWRCLIRHGCRRRDVGLRALYDRADPAHGTRATLIEAASGNANNSLNLSTLRGNALPSDEGGTGHSPQILVLPEVPSPLKKILTAICQQTLARHIPRRFTAQRDG